MGQYRNEMALLDTLRKRAEEEGLPLRVILKEALQIYALAALYSQPASERVTFQGGTCLRLVHGTPRYSEDMDFVTTLDSKELSVLFEPVSRDVARLAPLFDGEITLHVQKATAEISRWRIRYRAAREQDSTSVSLEFAPYPAYSVQRVVLAPPMILPGLPLIVVRAETLEEIMADKVIAVAGRRYIKGRDVFDLWWLKQKGVKADPELIRKKQSDYHLPPGQLKVNLTLIEAEAIQRELQHFLPYRYRVQVLQEDVLKVMVSEVKGLLADAIS